MALHLCTTVAAVAAETNSTEGLSLARLEVARLYTRSMLAAERHEEARRKADRKMVVARRLAEGVAANRDKLLQLRELSGHIATMQYRNSGLSLTAKLLASGESPETFIQKLTAAHNADMAVQATTKELRQVSQRLARSERSAAVALQSLKKSLREASVAKAQIVEELAKAQQWVRQLEAQENPLRITSCDHIIAPVSDAGGPESVDSTRGWVAPVRGYKLSSGFAAVGPHWQRQHTGQDFAVKTGTPVYSVGDGVVIVAGCDKAFGINVIVRHANGYFTQYAHLSALQVRGGSRVSAGQKIGESGCTGNCTGPHLHFEVRITPRFGSAVNPISWLRANGVAV
ncbi:peptidoglycan DD-metalloendopeptidase family protein [Streptomyces lavendulocolor]|uniref:peptidoglycan DD-metalloendopeptidase family protein n=1 Tax=Streptomyces lavendulocolor TaxID=67316 RepID=UPI0034076218